MKKIFLLFFYLSLSFSSFSQQGWVKSFGDSVYTSIFPFDIEGDSSGIYTTGPFSGIADFDPNNGLSLDTSRSIFSAYINKLDSNGNYLWSRSLKSSTSISYYSQLGPRGEIIVSGYFYDTLYIDDGFTKDTLYNDKGLINSIQNFIVKFDKDGNYNWSRAINMGQSLFNLHLNIVIDNSSNVYFSGPLYEQDSIDIDPGPAVQIIYGQKNSSFLAKLDSNGTYINNQLYPFNIFHLGNFDKDIFFHANFVDTLNLVVDSAPISLYASKMNNSIYGRFHNFDLEWVNVLTATGNTGFLNFDELPLNSKKELYLSGAFSDTLFLDSNFNNYLSSSGPNDNDGFLIKVDSSGNILWKKLFSAAIGVDNGIEGIVTDDDDNIWTVQGNTGIAEFSTDTGIIKVYLGSFYLKQFIVKLDSLANLKRIVPLNRAFVSALHWSTANNLIFTGEYSDTLIITDTVISSGNRNRNAFVAKLEDCIPIKAFDSVTVCAKDPNAPFFVSVQDSGIVYTVKPSYIGCDTLQASYLTVLPSYSTASFYTFCQSDSLQFSRIPINKDTTILEVYKTALGCDSSFISTIKVNTIDSSFTSDTICFGDSIVIQDSIYSSNGNYLNYFINKNGCDSILQTNLIVRPKSTFDQEITICEGDSFQLLTSNYSLAGVYFDTTNTVKGCDSIIKTTLSLTLKDSINIQQTLCEGEVYRIGGDAYTSSGIYTNTFISSKGCDSVVTLILDFIPRKFVSQLFNLCKSDSIRVGNNFYSEDGNFLDTLNTNLGCDSVIETRIEKIDLNVENTGKNKLIAKQTNAIYKWISCDFDSLSYVNDSSQSISFEQPVAYRLIIEWENCKDTTDCITAEFETNEFRLWPNPNSGAFRISIPETGKLKYFDSRGKLIREKEYLEAGIFFENLQQFSSGMYILLFEGNERNYQLKMVKTK